MSEILNEYIIGTTISRTALHTPSAHTDQILTKNVLIGDKLAAIDIENGIVPDEIDAKTLPEQTIISKRKTVTPKINTNEVQTQSVYLAEDGMITFADETDGTIFDSVTKTTGYVYTQVTPTTFANSIVYDIGELSNDTNLENITFAGGGKFIQTCELWFSTPATLPTKYKWPKNTYWIDSPTGAAPTLIASKNYRIVFRQEPTKIIASVAYLY